MSLSRLFLVGLVLAAALPARVTLAKPAPSVRMASSSQLRLGRAGRAAGSEKASLPMYELQMAVWPTDESDVEHGPGSVLGPITADSDGEWVEVDGADIDDDADSAVVFGPSLDLWPTVVDSSAPSDEQQQQQPHHSVTVLEDYRNIYANGTQEFKLVLSNGMVNYQRVSTKIVNGEEQAVQEGHYTVPIVQPKGQERFQTMYYVADERGFNIYKSHRAMSDARLPPTHFPNPSRA